MTNPVLVEITRGGIVESRHRGSLTVVDTTGDIRLSLGDINLPVFPRSAIKALQAVASFETGAIEEFNLNDAEIALACSSHSGEVDHVKTSENMLKKAGLSVDDLECGAHWPSRETAAYDLARSGGKPCALHNNCSGKHAGMLASAVKRGLETRGYIKPEHELQQRVRRVIESFCGLNLIEAPMGIDGCSLPTWAMPLDRLAFGFARFGTGAGLDAETAQLCDRIRSAVALNPFMVAGTDRFCTRIMEKLGKKAFVKTGAEGVFCASLPELGLGVALKIDDGATRSSELVMAQLLHMLGVVDHYDQLDFAQETTVSILNRNNIKTGEVKAATALANLKI